LLAKLKAWKDSPEQLTLLEEVPGIRFETWLVDIYVIEFPPTLNSAQRRHVHAAAIDLELAHISVGEGDERRILISRDPEFLAIMLNECNESQASNPSSVVTTAAVSATVLSPESLLGPSRVAGACKWFDASVILASRLEPHYFRASQTELDLERALQRDSRAYFGIHPKLQLQLLLPSFPLSPPGGGRPNP